MMATLTLVKPRGRPEARPTEIDWQDEAAALLAERAAVRQSAARILPFARYVHQATDDLIAEQAQAGVVVFLERLAGPRGDAA